jgi:uncharacterized membrane protein
MRPVIVRLKEPGTLGEILPQLPAVVLVAEGGDPELNSTLARFGAMGSRSQHISIGIDRPVTVVYDVAADPLKLPKWAAGLAGSLVEQDGEQWFTESPMGRATFTFAPRNDFGVLDHEVTLLRPVNEQDSGRSGIGLPLLWST